MKIGETARFVIKLGRTRIVQCASYTKTTIKGPKIKIASK